jgi:hypothetical protein
MKVKISDYRYRWTSQIHYDYMNKKYDHEWEDNTNLFESFLQKFENILDWLYNVTINRILDNLTGQQFNVRIDPYDTWSMDYTLSHIIVPMLVQLKATKHGAPWTDDEDVPEELRSTNGPPKENEWDTDGFHFKRWDWVLDEMIWAFEQKCRDDWESDYYELDELETLAFGQNIGWQNKEGRIAHQKRMTNGFRLFGKYYEHLWD